MLFYRLSFSSKENPLEGVRDYTLGYRADGFTEEQLLLEVNELKKVYEEDSDLFPEEVEVTCSEIMIEQGLMTPERVLAILDCKRQEVIPEYKNMIFNLPDSLCEEYLDGCTKHLWSGGRLADYEIDLGDLEPGELTDLQTVGVKFLHLAESAMLADDVGLGKTVQVAGLINLLKVYEEGYDLLFLAEKAGVRDLALKLMKFTGDYFYALDGGATERNVNKFLKLKDAKKLSLVAPHSVLSNKDFMAFAKKRKFAIVVFDESSLLKRIRTQVYKNTREIARTTNRFIELNATPVEVLGADVYNQLNLLGGVGWLYSKGEFDSRYARKTFKMGRLELVYNKDASMFLSEVALRYLSRTRNDVEGIELGDNLAITLEIKPSVEQRELLKVSSFYSYIADYPSRLNPSIPLNGETCPKLGALESILEYYGVKEEGGKALVYCYFREAQQGLAEYLTNVGGYKVEILSGTESSDNVLRDEILDRFRYGDTQVLLTNVKKSLDIKGCNLGVIYSIDPNPQKMVQFVGRLTRSLDVTGKNIFVLALEGRELRNLNRDIMSRVHMTQNFLGQKHSLLYDALDNRYSYCDLENLADVIQDYNNRAEGDELEKNV